MWGLLKVFWVLFNKMSFSFAVQFCTTIKFTLAVFKSAFLLTLILANSDFISFSFFKIQTRTINAFFFPRPEGRMTKPFQVRFKSLNERTDGEL